MRCRLLASLLLVFPGPLMAQDEPPAPDAETHEQRARVIVEQLTEAGFAVDGERLTIEVRELEACLDDVDRQQDLFFRPTHFRALGALVWATSPGMTDPPAGALIRRSSIENMVGSIGAYYQFDRKALVFPKSLLASLNEAIGARDFMIAHELVHAHQAQREGGLAGILQRQERTVEQVRIAQCLLEGEAELVALSLIRGRQGETLADVTEEDLARASEANSVIVGAGDQIYDLGRRAVLAAYQLGGWDAVRQLVMQEHPVSSEQLMHPGKRGQDSPEDVTLPAAPEGWQLVHDDVFGELQLTQILGAGFPDRGEQAALGWDGDRLRLFEGPAGEHLFVWRTVWDRELDAEQFAALLPEAFVTHHGRVVDLVRASDPDVAQAYRDSLPAWERPADPKDAESTAALEEALAARLEALQDRRDGQRWEVTAAGVAFVLPEGFETSRRGASHIAALTAPSEDGIAFADNVGVIVMPNPLGLDYEAHLELNRAQIRGMPGLTLNSLEVGEVAGRRALIGGYQGTIQAGAPPLHFRLILLLREQDQIVITGTSLLSRQEVAGSLIDELMDSLSLVE